MKLVEMKELENHSNQLNWCSSPHSILVNGATDYCSLSTSSSETEGQSNPESEPTHQESPVSLNSSFNSIINFRRKKTDSDESSIDIIPNINMWPCLI